MRLLHKGEYHPEGAEHFVGAMIVAFNDDDTVNIRAYDGNGEVRPALNVPLEGDADDGVHFFRPYLD